MNLMATSVTDDLSSRMCTLVIVTYLQCGHYSVLVLFASLSSFCFYSDSIGSYIFMPFNALTISSIFVQNL